MDVASSLLFSNTPFSPLIICSCFMLCLTTCSLGETAGALPVDGEGAGKGEDSARCAKTAQENQGCSEIAYLRAVSAAGRPGHGHGTFWGQEAELIRATPPVGVACGKQDCRDRRWEEISHIPGFGPLHPQALSVKCSPGT